MEPNDEGVARYGHSPGNNCADIGPAITCDGERRSLGPAAPGDAREPHLHFEVAPTPKLLEGGGVPYVIERYRIAARNGAWQVRTRELPLDGWWWILARRCGLEQQRKGQLKRRFRPPAGALESQKVLRFQ